MPKKAILKKKASNKKGLKHQPDQLTGATDTTLSQLSINRIPRNPYVNHPLMCKGGVHQKSKSAQRTAARRETKKMARDWSTMFNFSIDYWSKLFYK